MSDLDFMGEQNLCILLQSYFSHKWQLCFRCQPIHHHTDSHNTATENRSDQLSRFSDEMRSAFVCVLL